MNQRIFLRKLIYNWCNEYGRYGLTIPYLIGSIKLMKKDNYTINDLFEDLVNIDIIVKISYCADLDELIIGTFKTEDAPLEYYNQLNNNIYFVDNEYFKDFTELITFCKNEYSNKLRESLFSKNIENGVWQKFDKNDLDDIKQLTN